MKYLKTYESIENKITIDLLSFCDFFGSMHKAVEHLKELEKYSSHFKFTTQLNSDYKNLGHSIEQFTLEDEYVKNEQDSESINLNDCVRYSYGFLNKTKANVMLIFYNVKIENIDKEILIFIDSQKYNL